MDEHVWITGIYEPTKKHDEWVSFSYGPFPTQEEADAVADSSEQIMAALGTDVATGEYEITDVSLMRYSQACKHFEETIESKHFVSLLPETHAAHLRLMERQIG